jgi:hypothetical protein
MTRTATVTPLPTRERPDARPLRRTVDDWGRDALAVGLAANAMRARWDIAVGGDHHLPEAGALLVNNGRRRSMAMLYTALAVGDIADRAVRFAGRPDSIPFGPALRRLGGILLDPAEIAAALRNGDVVVVSASPGRHPRQAGAVAPRVMRAAIDTGVPVHPLATVTTIAARRVRIELGPQVSVKQRRRGPLADLELAEAAQRALQSMLDTLGGLHTGVAPIDWITRG